VIFKKIIRITDYFVGLLAVIDLVNLIASILLQRGWGPFFAAISYTLYMIFLAISYVVVRLVIVSLLERIFPSVVFRETSLIFPGRGQGSQLTRSANGSYQPSTGIAHCANGHLIKLLPNQLRGYKSHFRDDGTPKRCYETDTHAIDAGIEMRKKSKELFSWYLCSDALCGHWHIGHFNER
jgi:hypothetical protein